MQAQPLITVSSVSASARFYCALLGARRGHEGENYAQILVGDEMIMQLHDFESDDNHEPLVDLNTALGNGFVLWFETDDFDALLQRVKDHGLTTDRKPFENVYAKQMECWLRDPDGYRVVIAGPSQYPRQPVEERDTP